MGGYWKSDGDSNQIGRKLSERHCQVSGCRLNRADSIFGMQIKCVDAGFGHTPTLPCREARLESDTMTRGTHAMSGQHAVLPDRTETGEKCLRAFGAAKAAHLPFVSAGGLVAILGAVVHARSRLDEFMLHVRKFRDRGFCRRITAQPVGDNLARRRG